MKGFSRYFSDPYQRVEVAFFLIYFLLFDILTGMEYNLYEGHNSRQFLHDIPGQLTYGAFNMVFAWLCFKILVQRFLFQKKYLQFALLFGVYLVMLNFYKLFTYWSVSQMTFLPASTRMNASAWLHAGTPMHFSIVYVLRELLVLAALGYFIRSARQEQLVRELREQKMSSELNFLKIQLQPHFFFNTLNNIYSLTLQGSPKAAPLIARHAGIMRYILYDSASPFVSLTQEIEFLKNMVAVEAVRYPEGIDIRFDSQGIGEASVIEPMLLLPYIENTFKHGIRESAENGYVRIIVCQVGDELILQTSNSIPGTCTAAPKGGIGQLNSAKRLSLLYPDRHELNIEKTDTSYELTLKIKLRTDGKVPAGG